MERADALEVEDDQEDRFRLSWNTREEGWLIRVGVSIGLIESELALLEVVGN